MTMPVSRWVAHLLQHTEAEAAQFPHEGQQPGVLGRAVRVQVLVNPYLANPAVVSRVVFLDLLRDRAVAAPDAGLGTILAAIDEDDDGMATRLVLQEWVGTNRGPLDG